MGQERALLIDIASDLEKADRTIEELEAAARASQGEAMLQTADDRDSRETLLRTLREQTDALRADVEQARDADDSVWETFKSKLDAGRERLRQALSGVGG